MGKYSKKNIWLDGIMGVIIGDALGCPVQFMDRKEIKERGPVTGMEGHGTYDMPAGTWTDDGSMTLATLDSIKALGEVDPEDIMESFIDWYEDGEYTPFGEAFDEGNTCSFAISDFEKDHDLRTCGRTSERSNGNGSLMRILPVCLFACENDLSDEDALKLVHAVSGLTHNHPRSKMACGLYYFCVLSLLNNYGGLNERLQSGIDHGFSYYEKETAFEGELSHYERLRNLSEFANVPEDNIQSSGYVVASLEAALWSLITTGNFRDCELKAVNLADDSDTIGAISGGLAGLYYGYTNMPEEWLSVIQRREWIEEMCISSDTLTDPM